MNSLEFYMIVRDFLLIRYYMSLFSDINAINILHVFVDAFPLETGFKCMTGRGGGVAQKLYTPARTAPRMHCTLINKSYNKSRLTVRLEFPYHSSLPASMKEQPAKPLPSVTPYPLWHGNSQGLAD